MRLPEGYQVTSGPSYNADLKVLDIVFKEVFYETFEVHHIISEGVNSVEFTIYEDATSNILTEFTNNIGYYQEVSGAKEYTKYMVVAQAYSGLNATGNYGPLVVKYITTNKRAYASWYDTVNRTRTDAAIAEALGIIKFTPKEEESTSEENSSPSDLESKVYNSQLTRSIFQLSNTKKDKTIFTTAEREFSKLDINSEYYAFGTTVYMKATADTYLNSGGFMIFSSNKGRNGYYLSIQSTDSADYNKQNPFRILKVKNGQMSIIPDSQETTVNGAKQKFGSIFNGESYKVDIMVKRTSSQVEIIAYINGFRIVAIDKNNADLPLSDMKNAILPATKNISLVCETGTMYFDYIYTGNSNKPDYDTRKVYSVVNGEFSDYTIDSSFGDAILKKEDGISNKPAPSNYEIVDFGLVAREIRKYDIIYENKPGIPSHVTTGGNTAVKIVKSNLTNFGAQIYVMNNAGTTVPLVDGNTNNLWVVGTTISRVGDVEYVDDLAGKFSTPNPAIFDAKWIQSDADAVALAEWIKTTWSKKSAVLELSVTGNPIISVGDVISVLYPYLSLDSSKKYVVTQVIQRVDQGGLSTEIKCRTL